MPFKSYRVAFSYRYPICMYYVVVISIWQQCRWKLSSHN